MNILILGSGGREHALAWKAAQSPLCQKLFIAPGNAGTLNCGENVKLDINSPEEIAAFVEKQNIDLLVVGPEEPLVRGIRESLEQDRRTKDLLVVGPGKTGAALEGSKEFAKEFMVRHQIPTAAYQSFTKETFEDGVEFLKKLRPPYVLKADGLAAGKGVLICMNMEDAIDGLDTLLNKEAFGEASRKVVIEEFLNGIELSVFVATDGKDWVLLPEAKDYKRIGEGDTGPNTGGMGAVSPVPFANEEFLNKVKARVIQPTIDGLIKDKIPYKGFIFIGLMNVNSDPYVIEYNVRMGDPETEVVIPRITSDLVELLRAIATGNLKNYKLETTPETAVTVMLVSGGYPGEYKKGHAITGIEDVKGSTLFFAGAQSDKGKIMTSGGRVLAITSLNADMNTAIELSMSNAEKIQYRDKNYRRDIGKDLQNQANYDHRKV